MRQTLAPCFVLTLLIMPSGGAQEPVHRPMTVDVGLDMIQESNPQIPPDGKRALFSRSELDWKPPVRPEDRKDEAAKQKPPAVQ